MTFEDFSSTGEQSSSADDAYLSLHRAAYDPNDSSNSASTNPSNDGSLNGLSRPETNTYLSADGQLSFAPADYLGSGYIPQYDASAQSGLDNSDSIQENFAPSDGTTGGDLVSVTPPADTGITIHHEGGIVGAVAPIWDGAVDEVTHHFDHVLGAAAIGVGLAIAVPMALAAAPVVAGAALIGGAIWGVSSLVGGAMDLAHNMSIAWSPESHTEQELADADKSLHGFGGATVDAIAGSVGMIGGGIAANFLEKPLAAAGESMGNTVGSFFQGLMPKVGDAGNAVLSVASKTVQKGFSAASAAANEIGGIGTAADGNVTFASTLKPHLDSAVTFTKDAVQKTAQTLTEGSAKIAERTVELAAKGKAFTVTVSQSPQFQAAMSKAADLGSKAADVGSKVASNIDDKFQAAQAWTNETAVPWTKAGVTKASEIAAPYVEKAKPAVAWIAEKSSPLTEKVQAGSSWVNEKLPVDQVKQALASQYQLLKNGVAEISSDPSAWAQNQYSILKGGAENIRNGLPRWAEIKTAAADVRADMPQMAEDFKAYATTELPMDHQMFLAPFGAEAASKVAYL